MKETNESMSAVKTEMISLKIEAWKAGLLFVSVVFHAALFAYLKMPEYVPRVPQTALIFNLVDEGRPYVPPDAPITFPRQVERNGLNILSDNTELKPPDKELQTLNNIGDLPSHSADGIEDKRFDKLVPDEAVVSQGSIEINNVATDYPAADAEAETLNIGSNGDGSGDDSNGASSVPSSDKTPLEQESKIDVSALQNEYVAGVKSKIYGCKFYPEQAKRMEREGSVKVVFTLSSGGDLNSVSVSASSGFDDLDSAAVQAVRNAAPFTSIPAELSKSSLTIGITLKYYLK